MKKNKNTIESKVAQTILQEPLEVKIGSKTYKVAQPSIATLIKVSESVSKLPKVKLDSNKIAQESLFVAKDSSVLGEVTAILILGAKTLKAESSFSHRAFNRLRGRTSKLQRLTDELNENCSPNELFQTISKILGTMQLSDFFALTTFLTEVNLLHPTRKVEN